jgi:hypothetical protein
VKPLPDVADLLDRLDRVRLFLAKLLKDVRATHVGDDWDAITLARTLEAAEQTPSLSVDLITAIANVRSKVESHASKAILELDADIRDICTRRKWKLDGQWPRLHIERAVDLTVDEKRRSIALSGTILPNFSSNVIEQALDKVVKELLPRQFDPRKFMGELARAYDHACGGKGGEAALLRVYRELVLASQPPKLWRDARASSFSEFTADQFRARLSASLEAGVSSSPDGRELRLLPPIDPADAMFVYQPAERRFGFVGRIEFR